MNQLPQHNAEAERAVLGSCVRDNPVIDDVLLLLSESDFYLDAHQKIFTVISDLWNAGKPADIVTVAERLQAANLIADVGGYVYLGDLLEAAPTAANATHYAAIVREKALFRKLHHVGCEIARSAEEPRMDGESTVAEAEKSVLAIAERSVSEPVSLIDALRECYDRMDARSSGEALQGVMTGFIDLDEITSGFHDGELVIVAARPSAGKTAFALALARGAAVEDGVPVYFASLEQSKVELSERLLCSEARVDGHKLRRDRLNADEMGKVVAAGDALRKGAQLWIDDAPGQSVLRIAANARRFKRRHGIRLVVIDYLQLIEPDDRRQPREQQVATMSRRLKCLARELKIPVICLAQLNRNVETRTGHTPLLSDLRESGSVEQDADVVLFLHRPEMYSANDRVGEADVIVAKQRNGPTGKVTLTFLKHSMRFENFATPSVYR